VPVFSSLAFGSVVGKNDYVEEPNLRYGMRRKCVVEESPRLKDDIRKPILPFVRLLSLSSHSLSVHLVFLLSVEVIRYRIPSHCLFPFL